MNKELINFIALTRFIELLKTVPSFFATVFFVRMPASPTGYINLDDTVLGAKKVAPYVKSTLDGVFVSNPSGVGRMFKAPYINLKAPVSVEELSLRESGMSPVAKDGITPFNQRLFNKTKYLKEMIANRVEQMCAEAIVEGKITIKGEGVIYVIDFGRSSELSKILTGSVAWNSAGAKPISDLRSARRATSLKGGVTPDTIVMGFKAFDSFINSSEAKEYVNNKIGLAMNQYRGDEQPNGAIEYITIPELGTIYTHEGSYIDEKGNSKDFIDPWTVVYGKRGIGELHFGAIENMKAGGLVALEEFVHSVEYPNGKGGEVIAESAPCAISYANSTFKLVVGNG